MMPPSVEVDTPKKQLTLQVDRRRLLTTLYPINTSELDRKLELEHQ